MTPIQADAAALCDGVDPQRHEGKLSLSASGHAKILWPQASQPVLERLVSVAGKVPERADIGDLLRNAGVSIDAAGVTGGIAKCFIYIIFFQVAANTLGLP